MVVKVGWRQTGFDFSGMVTGWARPGQAWVKMGRAGHVQIFLLYIPSTQSYTYTQSYPRKSAIYTLPPLITASANIKFQWNISSLL